MLHYWHGSTAALWDPYTSDSISELRVLHASIPVIPAGPVGTATISLVEPFNAELAEVRNPPPSLFWFGWPGPD